MLAMESPRLLQLFFEVNFLVHFTIAKANDSNDYCDRLIYLSCNNYIMFLVSLTSFKERGLQLPVTRKRR